MSRPVKPRVREDLATVELDGEAVVYDERTGRLHHLNGTATVVFRLCDGTSTMRTLSSEVSEAYGLPLEEVEPAVRAAVRSFRRAGLLEGSIRSDKGVSRGPSVP